MMFSTVMGAWPETGQNTGDPNRLYQVFDRVEKPLPNYKPETNWCTKCKVEADKKFKEHGKYIHTSLISSSAATLFHHSDIRENEALHP